MKKVLSCLFLLVLVFAAVMPMALAEEAAPVAEEETLAIIGGADGPTAILVADTTEDENAEETEEAGAPKMQFGFYPDRFVDSLQYMLKGLVGIFLVTGLIILVLVVMDKAGNRKKKDAE